MVASDGQNVQTANSEFLLSADRRAIAAAAPTESIARATAAIRATPAAPGLTPIKEAHGESKCRWELIAEELVEAEAAPIAYEPPAAPAYSRPIDLD